MRRSLTVAPSAATSPAYSVGKDGSMMYVDEVEQRFEEYELAYLDELRRQMSLSPEVPDALPYFL
jgi:hypothetical protein